MSSALSIYYTTVPNIEVGQKLSETLVTKKIAACCNMISNVSSTYEWEGKVVTESEVVLLIKAPQGSMDSLQKEIKNLNYYETPCLIELSPKDCAKPFETWAMDFCK